MIDLREFRRANHLTQIYAKIVDENKRRTVNLIPDIVVGKDRP